LTVSGRGVIVRRVGGVRPLSLFAGFTAEEVDDGGLLIRNEEGELVLRLNRSAAVVWRSSDGNHTVSDLVEVLTAELGEQADDHQVLIALDELEKHGLIESGYDQRDPAAARLSRRQFVRRVGAVAVVALGAMPIVHSLVVPEPAEGSTLGKHYMYCPKGPKDPEGKPPKHFKPPYTSNCGPRR
jgi:Coenzyme PQQ synthesis protein D (PqqD)